MLVIDEDAGDWVYDRLTAEERAYLSEAMQECAEDDYNEFACNLGNAGLSNCSNEDGIPTEQDMRDMCRQLTLVRFVDDQIQVDWNCLLRDAFGEGCERVRGLYIEATGITDEDAFALKERDPGAVAEAMRRADDARVAWVRRMAEAQVS